MAVAKTTTGGTSWSRHILESSTVGFTYSIAFDPSNSSVVYAAGHVNLLAAVFRTTDGGLTWSRCNSGITGMVYSIAVDPANSSILYAGTVDGVHKSTNGGATWENVGAYGVVSVAVDPARPTTIYAGTSLGVYVSTNAGVDWFERNQGMATKSVLCVSKISGAPLYAGTEGYSVYEWQDVTAVDAELPNHIHNAMLNILPNPAAARTVLQYCLDQPGQVSITLFDRAGRTTRMVFAGWQNAGDHRRALDLTMLPRGVYFVRLVTARRTVCKSLVIAR